MKTTVRALIDLGALRRNLSVVRDLCPRSQIMAMVKADAYGHGLVPAAKALDSADGFAVARLHEALTLRETGVSHRVLLLSTLLDASELALCSELKIDVTAHDPASVELIAAQAERLPLRVWLKLDSGMHRMGLSPRQFVEADQVLRSKAGVLELTHMTHFSCADNTATSVTDQQLACFSDSREAGSRIKASLANSAALISRPDTHADWVRPGIMLYGINPFGASRPLPLLPAMTLKARIVAIREIPPGEHVGYNSRWLSLRASRIGTVGVGYGDGYPRHAGNGTPVLVNGVQAPLVGQVSMDSLTVDLTDIEQVDVGDEVTLWGSGLSAAVVAEFSNTIAYELFTSVNQRVSREYFEPQRPRIGERPVALEVSR